MLEKSRWFWYGDGCPFRRQIQEWSNGLLRHSVPRLMEISGNCSRDMQGQSLGSQKQQKWHPAGCGCWGTEYLGEYLASRALWFWKLWSYFCREKKHSYRQKWDSWGQRRKSPLIVTAGYKYRLCMPWQEMLADTPRQGYQEGGREGTGNSISGAKTVFMRKEIWNRQRVECTSPRGTAVGFGLHTSHIHLSP